MARYEVTIVVPVDTPLTDTPEGAARVALNAVHQWWDDEAVGRQVHPLSEPTVKVRTFIKQNTLSAARPVALQDAYNA